jgi:hypothetical protein
MEAQSGKVRYSPCDQEPDTDNPHRWCQRVHARGIGERKDEHLIIAVKGKFDRRDNPVTGTPFADTVSYLLLNAHTIEGIAKKDGRVIVKETAVL